MKIYKIHGQEIIPECNEWSTYELILDNINSGEVNNYSAKMLLISGNNLLFPVTSGGNPTNESDLLPGVMIYIGDGIGETYVSGDSAVYCSTVNSDPLIISTIDGSEIVSIPAENAADTAGSDSAQWYSSAISPSFLATWFESASIGDRLSVKVKWVGCTGCNGDSLPERGTVA